MAKLLKCKDLNPRCIFEIRGNSEAEVLEKAAEHFQADHNMQNISPDILIRDEAEGQALTASSLQNLQAREPAQATALAQSLYQKATVSPGQQSTAHGERRLGHY